MQSTIEIEVDLDKAQAVGMTPGDVRRAEATLVQGIQVGSLFEDQKVFDVIVQGVPSTRRSLEDIQNLLIDRPGGGTVRLGDVAEVRMAETPSVIRRDAVSRRMDIVAGIGSRPIADITADVQATLDDDGSAAGVPRRGGAAEQLPTRSAPDWWSGWASPPCSPRSCCSRRPPTAGGWRWR